MGKKTDHIHTRTHKTRNQNGFCVYVDEAYRCFDDKKKHSSDAY